MIQRLIPFALVLAVVACHSDSPTVASPETAAPALAVAYSSHGGNGAMAVPNCLGEKGAEFTTIVPVSETDWYVTPVALKSTHCRTLKSGWAKLTFLYDITGDIPLPQHEVMVTLGEDKLFNIFDTDGTFIGEFPIWCGYPLDPTAITYEARVWTAPSGISGAQCTHTDL
jgi:hypothetical protein